LPGAANQGENVKVAGELVRDVNIGLSRLKCPLGVRSSFVLAINS
jgi:hypothetical protein